MAFSHTSVGEDAAKVSLVCTRNPDNVLRSIITLAHHPANKLLRA